MADNNPFSGLFGSGGGYNPMFDPKASGGTLTGFIGGLMGAPTQDQAQGSAVGKAVQSISELRAQGKTPQEAALTYFQTPEGQDFFAHSGPTGMKQLVDSLSATISTPTITTLAPGATAVQTDQSGKQIGQFNNPQTFAPTVLKPGEQAIDRTGKTIATSDQPLPDTDAVRTFKSLTSIAKLPDAEIKKLAISTLDPTKQSVDSQAIDRLVTDYGLDVQTGEKLKAGVLKITPLTNEYGQQTGDSVLVDLSNPNSPLSTIIKPNRSATQPGVASKPLPGSTPETGAPAGVLPAAPAGGAAAPLANPTKASDNKTYFGSKADMFLGSGVVPNALGTMSNISEQLNPGAVIPEGARSNDRQNLINTLRNSIAAMGAMGEGLNVNKATLDSYMKLAPTGKANETPHEGVQKAIRLHENVTQEIEAEEAKARDSGLPSETRKAAVKVAEGWKKVLRALPTMNELTKMEEDIREGRAGAPTLVEGGKAALEAGKKMLTETKKQAKEAGVDIDKPAAIDIDKINDPQELLAIDPFKLDKPNKIKLLRKLDQMQKGSGKRSEAEGNTQVAEASVSQLHPPGTFSRNTQGGDVVNGVAKTLGIGPPNNVIKFPSRTARG
jgi:hypothetical protein